VKHLERLLTGMTQDAGQRVSSLPLLDDAERRQLIEGFNATRIEHPPKRLLHELFEEQAAKSPDAVALIFEGQQLSYGELNRRANQVAHYLRARGVGPDQRVVICMERNLDAVVGVLGILKAGGAYVPLDASYPDERLQYMLKDAAPEVVLIQEPMRNRLGDVSATVIALDSGWDQIAGQNSDNIDARSIGLTPQHLVYVIYTSGSTGVPKGVCLPHRALVNLMYWHGLELQGVARTLQLASLSFDASIHELFAAWICGGAAVIAREELRRDIGALAKLIRQQKIGKAVFPVVVLQELAATVLDGAEDYPDLRELMATGEQLQVNGAIRGLFERLPHCRLHNHYGPSESHVVTSLCLQGNPAGWPTFPSIGRPIANTQIYILDAARQPVPVGVIGEIHIGGVNVARGYLNQPELTDSRFIPDPFSADPATLMYKSGDLGRYHPDGSIEYMGRNDSQVKIRGHRVELGEVESHLVRHPEVMEAVVIVREDTPGHKRLVAYLTHRGSASGESLRAHLLKRLPEYMVPSAFVFMDALPLTQNGKVDRRALAIPDAGRAPPQSMFVAPRTAAETVVANIWKELLRVDCIGVDDNFFEAGGHSLLATQLASRICKVFEIDLPVRSLFSSPTVAGVVSEIARVVGSDEVVETIAQTFCTTQSLSEDEIDAMLAELETASNAVPQGAAM
jgi:amino acid adenylation domain-containing protein